jgi:hypothetical protein
VRLLFFMFLVLFGLRFSYTVFSLDIIFRSCRFGGLGAEICLLALPST